MLVTFVNILNSNDQYENCYATGVRLATDQSQGAKLSAILNHIWAILD